MASPSAATRRRRGGAAAAAAAAAGGGAPAAGAPPHGAPSPPPPCPPTPPPTVAASHPQRRIVLAATSAIVLTMFTAATLLALRPPAAGGRGPPPPDPQPLPARLARGVHADPAAAATAAPAAGAAALPGGAPPASPLAFLPPSTPSERVLACMPTVARPRGVDYLTPSVASFLAATTPSAGGGGEVARLLVFNMDADPAAHTAAVALASSTGAAGAAAAAGTDGRRVAVLGRPVGRPVRRPRRRTHGDPIDRIRWRSKEADDYATVAEECAAVATAAGATAILLLQDDVVVSPAVGGIVAWAAARFPSPAAYCSVSLVDIDDRAPGEPPPVDGKVLGPAQLVARLWPLDRVDSLVAYIRGRHDESPVDWLVRDWCAGGRRGDGWWGGGDTYVPIPCPVRHVGRVSTFEGNGERDNLT